MRSASVFIATSTSPMVNPLSNKNITKANCDGASAGNMKDKAHSGKNI